MSVNIRGQEPRVHPNIPLSKVLWAVSERHGTHRAPITTIAKKFRLMLKGTMTRQKPKCKY